MNFPCGVASNQNVGNFKPPILPVSTIKMIFPPSMLFLANLSGCHAKMPIGPFSSMRLIILLKRGRPGTLAVLLSMYSSITSKFSLIANSLNSVICDSMDKTCRSSSSVDFLA
ncbi:MAG: hypothetical protein WCV50_05630 [Patescibacteria group bacterium]